MPLLTRIVLNFVEDIGLKLTYQTCKQFKEERKESKRQEIEFFRKMPFKIQIEIIEYLKVKIHKKLTQN